MIAAPRIVITTGEPAGIGPDLIVKLAQLPWQAALMVIGDPDLLMARARLLNLPFPAHLAIHPVPLRAPVTPGKLNPANAAYVLETLTIANKLCLEKQVQAMVTGTVHKSVMNAAGISFVGHTEWLAAATHSPLTVMLFVVDGGMKVALATTHLPLCKVPAAITPHLLEQTIMVLNNDLQRYFHLRAPHILVAGLNPHAGEEGCLGREELEIITPTLKKLQQRGLSLTGPLPADTLFLPAQLAEGDAVLAMYHDQALPVVKSHGLEHAVNMTLGLPYVRTSVDHGTALDLAGTGKASAASLTAAVKLALAVG